VFFEGADGGGERVLFGSDSAVAGGFAVGVEDLLGGGERDSPAEFVVEAAEGDLPVVPAGGHGLPFAGSELVCEVADADGLDLVAGGAFLEPPGDRFDGGGVGFGGAERLNHR
jgi:hypothetical protein